MSAEMFLLIYLRLVRELILARCRLTRDNGVFRSWVVL